MRPRGYRRSMEWLLVVALIAVVVVGMRLWDTLWKGANRSNFRRGDHRRARVLRDSPLRFRTTGQAADVREWILGHLRLEDTRPSAVGSLYIVGRDSGTTRIAFGALLGGDHLTFDPTVAQDGVQARGTVRLLSWKEADGVMTSLKVLERAYRDIEAAVRRADPGAVVQSPLSVQGC